jgi:hypothetical protein
VGLASDGNAAGAMRIAWRLYRQTDMGLLQRAKVTLFIAMLAEPDIHDRRVYAQETLNLLQTIRDEGLQVSEAILEHMAKRANDVILEVNIEELDLSADDGDDPAEEEDHEQDEDEDTGEAIEGEEEAVEEQHESDRPPPQAGKTLYSSPADGERRREVCILRT